MKKYLITGIICIVMGLLIFLSQGVKAQSLPDSGLTFDKSITTHWQYFKTQIANASDPGTSTAFYNPADGTDSAAGAINTTSYTQSLTVEYDVPVLGSTGIDLTIWGRFGDNPNWALLHTEPIGTVTAHHESIEVEETPEALRVGRQATGIDGTDSISIWVRGGGWAQ